MATIGVILLVIGYICSLVFGIWFLIVAFRESTLWGLACMFVPFAALIFLVNYWQEAKTPFLGQLASIVPIVLGTMLQPGT